MKLVLFLVLHITLSARAHAVSDKDIGGDLESKGMFTLFGLTNFF